MERDNIINEIEEKFDDIRYFSKQGLEQNQELSSNMNVLILNINIENI